MTIPPSLAEIPFGDRDELYAWVTANMAACPPLALERLLGHFGYVDAGDMPTGGPVRCVVWAHGEVKNDPMMAPFRALVYHTELVLPNRVALVLNMIRGSQRHLAARAQRKSGG